MKILHFILKLRGYLVLEKSWYATNAGELTSAAAAVASYSGCLIDKHQLRKVFAIVAASKLNIKRILG